MAKTALVPVSEIPRETREVSTDDPIAVFRKFMTLQAICLREKGVGLAAVQIGVDDRMFVVKQGREFRCFLNAKYTPVNDEKFTSCEGCLSLPGRAFLVPRYQTVRVTGKEMVVAEGVTFMDVNQEVTDAGEAAVFQHEIDHCDGIMIDEIGREVRVRCA